MKRKISSSSNLCKKMKLSEDEKVVVNENSGEDSGIDYEEEASSGSSSDESDDESEDTPSDDIQSEDIQSNSENNINIFNDGSIERNLTKSIINNLVSNIKEKNISNNIDLYKYLDEQEDLMDNKGKNTDLIESSANEITSKILSKLINEIRHESYNNKKFNVINFLENKMDIIDELNYIINNEKKKPLSDNKDNRLVLQLTFDPSKYLGGREEEDYTDEESNDDEPKKKASKLDLEFLKFLKDGMFTPKDDLAYFKKLSDEEKQNYLDNIKEIKDEHRVDKPKILKVIESSNSLNNKSVILNKLQRFDSLTPFSGEYFKLKNWVDGIVQIPFGVYKDTPITLNSSKSKVKKYMNKVETYMDDAVYGHNVAKKQILQIIAHTISNPKEGGTVIAIQGPPGVGKTQLIQDGISKALQRPFEFISLGGATDSSFLEGHDYTYEGSQCGMIVNVLKKAKCMNPVIFFDELDKVSDTPKGREIINILTHLTDSTQNHHFNDKYYSGLDFDLSKCIFIFSFNDEWRVNRILKDRMSIIRTSGFKINDKIQIGKNYLIPRLLETVGFHKEDIIFSDEIIEFIIEQYTFEGGVRRLKECLLEISKEINLRKLDGSKLMNKSIQFPLTVTKEMLVEDIFKKKHVVEIEKIHPKAKIGLINGLWANDMGIGGMLSIEAFTIPTTNKLQLELTGMQGDVMKESMRVAKTVAWNIIPDKVKKQLNESWTSFGNSGIHIHCPDGSTPKDGPSAGAAITTAIISLLMRRKINNEIAMTGEINLKGEVTRIGGLSEKLNGAKKAGVKTVLIPKGNESDYNKILANEDKLIDSNFKVIMVSSIWQVLKHCFMKQVTVKKY
jgi:endopeptidase La